MDRFEMMTALPETEQRHLVAADGWLDLGNFNEATDELDQIPPTLRAHPEVLELRCEIYLRAKRWDEALTISETLVRESPNRLAGWLDRSEALYRLNRIEEATQKLFPALGTELYKHWQVKYALAQYASQQSQFRAAFAFLEGAFDMAESPDLKMKALDDPMLAPLWEKIGGL